MALETERKFLVNGDGWRSAVVSTEDLVQGYLSVDADREVRVRTSGVDRAVITVKGRRVGLTRSEFEYAIPMHEAREILTLCVGSLIEKRRHLLSLGTGRWVVDEFTGRSAGLVVAEVEWDEGQPVPPTPHWAGQDVSLDERYSNAVLSTAPFTTW
ncbi:CYTH domain-containing protein [Streptomyces bacillaris]|uniref:CYTH domain-containing protein n=1 Tax=Streptomyces bacillaris TaxID=68179 RepID=UPI003347C3EA